MFRVCWVCSIATMLLACNDPPVNEPSYVCEGQGAECGAVPDGRGGEVDCGECEPPLTCGGSGLPNICGQPDSCEPTSCAESGVDCGEIEDGCGEILTCGDPCCEPTSCEVEGVTCGEISDGCGDFLACGEACVSVNRVDPVVLQGAIFEGLEGAGVDALRLYQYTGARFIQVQSQVDERVNRTIDFSMGTFAIQSPELSYVYDRFGPLHRIVDDGLELEVDEDDEILFLADSTGARAPTSAWVEGADDRRYEITVTDPLDGSEGYVYLFAFSSGGAPEPLASSVEYGVEGPLAARITTPEYELAYSSGWVLDELRIAGGEDLIDRLKGRAFDLVEGETEELWDFLAVRVGTSSGPVRSIREVMGAASGVTTTYIAEYYADRVRVTTHLRVHEISNVWQYLDLDSRRGDMTYTDDVVAAPVAIDGQPDELSGDLRRFIQVDSSAGTLIQLFEFIDTSPLLNGLEDDVEFFYEDSISGVPIGVGDGTGDDQPAAWGAHGFHIVRLCMPTSGAVGECPGNDPLAAPCCTWTMPSGEVFNTGSYFQPLTFRTTWFPQSSEVSIDGAERLRHLEAPIEAQASAQFR